ncbi:unnamed protein product [Phaedon cochleariae]|uniref:WASP family protein member n=1 Tax=Phaedon cochleariae TaxID=80249 RepID=A0A9P0DM68_PHACE|nr:unnamed protein product [Phaedon cochleariae]
MPFVQRRVEPRHLSRTRLFGEDGQAKVEDGELQAVTNNTLCNALRQLASLVLVAGDIFAELGGQLGGIRERVERVKVRVGVLEERVERFDPKEVTVPESDICTFAARTRHYTAPQPPTASALFAPDTRPAALATLYAAAAATPVPAMRQLDRWRRDGRRSSGFFLCTPVLGGGRKRRAGGKVGVDIDIETGVPAAVEDLRRWTSDEALGDITVTPDCGNRITFTTEGDTIDGNTVASDDEGIDHKLPSPEEQVQVVALKFPAEIVAVDVSGRSFDRMSIQRRSLVHGDLVNRTTDGDTNAARRRTRTRKPRNRRRNTLAGTDQKEIRDAITAGEEPSSFNRESESSTSGAVSRSKSSDLLRSTTKKECPDNKKSHFNTLKQWGKNRYDRLMNKSSEKNETKAKDDIDDFNVYETVTMKRKRDFEMERRTHERNASISSSEKSSINVPITNTLSSVLNIAVRLRESSVQRRLRRTGGNKDEPHSSSGNWSASSESGRASIGSEITTTTQPKSTTSAATSNNSLNVPSSVNSRRRFVNNSASSSVTSEGTLTPDIIHDLHEDGETSSVYSCDTEGYYTSFHMDSGLKTLKEEETPPTPLHSTSAFSNSGSVLSAENEYELFGKGSTSTTTSSAGTVCTTLRASESNKSLVIGPAVPERKSSLSKLSNHSPESSLERDFGDKTGTVKRSPATKPVVVALVHKQDEGSKRNAGDVSPDSGHNTSSSPIESMSSPNGVRSGSDFEFSESSDMEGPERIERIRVKTTINSSRIPSMCVITPSHSDDESSNSSNSSRKNYQKQLQEKNDFNQKGEGTSEKDTEKIHHIINTMVNGASKLSLVSVNPQSGYATVQRIDHTDSTLEQAEKPLNTNVIASTNAIRAPSPSGGTVTIKETLENKSPTQPIIKASLLPLNNMFGRLKSNLANFAHKRDRSKSPNFKSNATNFDAGEYVTIADIRNNNEKITLPTEESASGNDVANRNLNTVLSGKIRDAEYVSLDELPCNENNNLAHTYTNLETIEKTKRQGAKVTVDDEGKVVYNSDSLKRRKNSHTTFQPGKNVKTTDFTCESPQPIHRTPKSVKPVTNTASVESNTPSSYAKSFLRLNPSTIPQQTPRDTGPISPTHKKERVQSPANPQLIPHAIPGSIEYLSPSSQKMYGYTGDQVLDMDVNRYLPNQYYLQRGSPMYSTLPLKKTQYLTNEARPERSVTPDITRGLERNNGNSLDRREAIEESPRTFYTFSRNAPVQKLGIPIQMPDINRLNLQNTSYTPTKLDPRGYTPSQIRANDEPDSLKISPIDPRHSGGFQSSTPSGKSSELKAAVNLDRKLLSPKKSTMSNEELYAVIHKSKKKMNIETEDTPRNSPVTVQNDPPRNTVQSPETGYIGDKSRGRLSWSPNKGEYVDFSSDIDKLSPPNESRSRQSWACNDRKPKAKQTSTIDFKRLLLQKSSISSPKKISAVEQLKLSREQIKPSQAKPQPEMNILNLSASPRSLVNRRFLNNAPGSPNREPKPVAKIMSPRSQWRFTNPRSDVLSSTILEDCREDESPNSSGERKASPKSGSKIVSTKDESRTSPKGMPRNYLENQPYTSATQRLYAQRAQFFNPMTEKSQSERQDIEEKQDPPTLETAF